METNQVKGVTLSKQTIQFLLVPDSSAARRLQRVLVGSAARQGVVVGTWPELIEYARNAYLAPMPDNDWSERFHTALTALVSAFWADSYANAPPETADAIESAFTALVSASDPLGNEPIPQSDQLSERMSKYLGDLKRLAEALDGQLPAGLSVMRDLLVADPEEAIQHLAVAYVDGVPALSRWQRAVIEKLNKDAQQPVVEALCTAQYDTIANNHLTQGKSNSLAILQSELFKLSADKATLDDSLQWVRVRDFLEEAEVAAGMVQSILTEHPKIKPAEIGLLLPDSFEYAVAVDDAFSRAGIAVSGLPVERWQRDLGREALFHFIYCRQKPAPAMALAVCLSSPLMPWTREEGAVLAQSVMDGDYRLRPFHSASTNARAMLALIRYGDEEPHTLIQAVQSFVSLLDGGEEFDGQLKQAKLTADELCALLENMTEIDWLALRRASNPKTITTGETPNFNIEGVTVWRESHEPWRSVRHLIVFGFAAGKYPSVSGATPVFAIKDLQAIRKHLDLEVDTPVDEMVRRRACFKRQLSAVSDAVTFLIPHRDPSGAAQSPSDSLVFMQQLFDIQGNMIRELDSEQDREDIRYLATAATKAPECPREITTQDIRFDRDLLALRLDADGNPRPESPSSLETLMVSRLAWLLRRLQAEPLLWAPESPNVMLLGTLAHQVFEELFQSGQQLPTKEEVTTQVGVLLDEAIKQHGPFLRAAQWQVERQHLATGISKAALAWRNMLEQLGAEILGSEEWLEGALDGISIHGQADALLGLSNNRLLVVDYKRSSAGSRRPRMQKGYDRSRRALPKIRQILN